MAPGDELSAEEIESTIRLLVERNVKHDGYYRAKIHDTRMQEVRRLARRLEYPGGRKYRRAVRRLRDNPFYAELAVMVSVPPGVTWVPLRFDGDDPTDYLAWVQCWRSAGKRRTRELLPVAFYDECSNFLAASDSP